jgi:hypothetical protein
VLYLNTSLHLLDAVLVPVADGLIGLIRHIFA